MAIYGFVLHLFAWSVFVAMLLPLTIPWSFLSYKIWHGAKEIDEDMSDEIWSRAWRVNGVLFLTAPVFLVLDYVAAMWLDLPAGPIHIVFYVAFMSFAAWMMMYFFSMEDFFQGLMLAVLHLYLPATLFFLIRLVISWNPLFTYILAWLKEPVA